MEDQDSAIVLYEVTKNKADEQTASKAVSALQGTIKEKVKNETTNIVTEAKIELIEKINSTELTLAGEINRLEAKMSSTELKLEDKINSLEVRLVDKISQSDEKTNLVEVRLVDKINSLEVRLINKINGVEIRMSKLQIQTIMWIVSMSVLQLVARYFFK